MIGPPRRQGEIASYPQLDAGPTQIARQGYGRHHTEDRSRVVVDPGDDGLRKPSSEHAAA